MAYDDQGRWKQEDDGVANRIAKITSGTSDYMRQARTQGLKTANRRGLGNSSMAVGAAESAAIGAASPIASQEAQQIAQKNFGQQEADNRTDQLGMQFAAAEREMQARAITDLSGQRYNAFAATLANPDIPADARAAVQRSINDQHTSALNYLQQLYGVSYNPTAQGGQQPPPAVPTTPGGSYGGYAPGASPYMQTPDGRLIYTGNGGFGALM